MHVGTLEDSTDLLGDPVALKQRWDRDGVLFLRGVIDPGMTSWAEAKFRAALASEELIDPSVDKLIWTGAAPKTRRPCDALGTEVWHEFAKLPLLNNLMRILFGDEPVWIPIVGHRSSMPSGALAPGQDIFAGRHQDSYFSQGMHYIVCWMPMKDADLDAGGFTVAPGAHLQGNFYDAEHKMLVDAIPDDAWRSADFRAGDVLIFDFFTPHATLPNPSNQIRISLDLRAISAASPQPVTGAVEALEGRDVRILTEDGERVTIHLTDETFIRDMHPIPLIPLSEVERIAFPGARVMATVDKNGDAALLRRNWY